MNEAIDEALRLLQLGSELDVPKAIEMLKRLQSQKDDVAWGVDWGKAGDVPCVCIIKRHAGGGLEVVAVEYGPRKEWVGLTSNEINELDYSGTRAKFVQTVEAKLKEKNA